jgi:DNA anti-recombination protein RmuC
MAIIREPEGIDFVVEPRELTDEDRRVVAEHIRAHKATQSQEEKNYNKAFTDVVRAMSRLRKAERRLRVAGVY